MPKGAITEHSRALVRARSGGMCEVCGLTPATNIHHRRARGMGGTRRAIHTPDWLLHLCGSGTQGCHGYVEAHPELSYAKGWKLRYYQHPSTAPVELTPRWYISDSPPVQLRWVLLQPDGTVKPWSWRA